MKEKCVNCGAVLTPLLDLCPECMRKGGMKEKEIEASAELRNIADVLSITADTDSNIKQSIKGILNIAERLEKHAKEV